MEEPEFETKLFHLGQDIGYMGLRVQKDAQKCLRDLRLTHDSKKFCSKLTEVFEKFSKFTVQYAKDLEDRIKEYNKEEDYNDVISKLRNIRDKNVKSDCNFCGNRIENNEEFHTDLAASSNNIDDTTDVKNYDMKNEVLSQYSFHIGGDDDVKKEELTQYQSPVLQEEDDVRSNDLINKTPVEETLPTQQQASDSSSTLVCSSMNPANVVNANTSCSPDVVEQEVGDYVESDDNIANSLEISHSEEIQSYEDQDEVVICDSATQNISEIPEVRNAQHKSNAIALPYEPHFRKPENLKNSSEGDEADISNIEENISNTIPSLHQDVENSFEKHSSTEIVIEEGDDSDVEIVSVTPKLEKGRPAPLPAVKVNKSTYDESDDSDIEIIEDASPPPEKERVDSRNIEEIDDSDVDNAADNSLQSDRRSITPLGREYSAKEENIDDSDDSDGKIVIDKSPKEVKDSVTKIKNKDSEVGTTALNSPRRENRLGDVEEFNGSDAETVDNNIDEVGIGSQSSDFERDTVHNSPSVENRLANVDEIDVSEAETVANDYVVGDVDADIVAREVGGVSQSSDFDRDTVHNSEAETVAGEMGTVSPSSDFDKDTIYNSPSGENRVDNVDEIDVSEGETIANNYVVDDVDADSVAREVDGVSQSSDFDRDTVHNSTSENLLVNADGSDTETVANTSRGNSDQDTDELIDDADTVAGNSPQQRGREAVYTDSDETTVANSPRRQDDDQNSPPNIAYESLVSKQKDLENSAEGEKAELPSTDAVPSQHEDSDLRGTKLVIQEGDDLDVEIVSVTSTLKESRPARSPEAKKEAAPMNTDDEGVGVTSEENDSEATIANLTPPQSTAVSLDNNESENDSDATIIRSPCAHQATVNHEENVSSTQDTQSSQIFDLHDDDLTQRVSQGDGQYSTLSEPDSDDSIYSKVTQKPAVDTEKSKTLDSDIRSTQIVSNDNAESSTSSESAGNCNRVVSNGDTTNDSNGDFIGLAGSRIQNTDELPEEEDEDEPVTQDLVITQNKLPENYQDITEAVPEDKENGDNETASQESLVFDFEKEPQSANEITQNKLPENYQDITEAVPEDKENGDNETASQESLVFDFEKEPQSANVSSPPIQEGSLSSPDDNNQNSSKYEDAKDGDSLSISEFDTPPSSCGSAIVGDISESDNPNEESVHLKAKKKLERKDRRSLLKIIAQYYLRKKREKVQSAEQNVHENNNESAKKKKESGETTKQKHVDRSGSDGKTKRKRRKYSNKKGEKEVKQCLDFVDSPLINESSCASADEADIRKGVSDSESIQTEKFDAISEKGRSINKKNVDERSAGLEEQEKDGTKNDKATKENGSDSEDSSDSTEIFDASKEVTEDKSGAAEASEGKEAPQTPSNFSSKQKKDTDDLGDNSSEDDSELTQKVDDLKKLKHLSEKQASIDDLFSEPTQRVSESLNVQKGQQAEDNDQLDDEENAVRRVVVPLPDVESDIEDAQSEKEESDETERESQVVSPFKKTSVKRLHSSDESESEPPKKTSERKSQESDVFDAPTQKVDKPCRRTSTKRVLSTEEKSELIQRDTDSEDDDIKRKFKRRKVQLDAGQSKDKGLDGDQNEDEDELVQSNQPNRFQLNDHDRDDLLNLLNQPTDNVSSSDQNIIEDDHEDENESIAPSQFKLGDSDRDNLLNLLTDKENDTKTEDETLDRSKNSEPDDIEIQPSQFRLNNEDRDELLDLLRSEQCDQDGKPIQTDLNTGNDSSKEESDRLNEEQFNLNNRDRDELLHLLSSDKSNESGEGGSEETENLERENDIHVKEAGVDKDIEPSNSKSQATVDRVTSPSTRETEQPVIALNDDEATSKKNNVDKNEEETMNLLQKGIVKEDEDDSDDRFTENSQGIDEIDDLDEDVTNKEDADEGVVDETEKDNDKKIEKAASKSEFKLDENERDELLNMLNEHIKEKDEDSESVASDNESDNGRRAKRRKKESKHVDKDELLELLQEYENTIGKDNALVENVKKGDFMGMESDSDIAKSNFCEDSCSESILLDLLKEEDVDQAADGQQKTPEKPHNTSKEAWNAYQQLLKDSDELSDSSSELSNVDIDDLEIDFSDQERRQKEKIAHAKLKKQFNIDKELVVNVERADISGFDLSSFSTKRKKDSSRVDSLHDEEVEKLCDISNVLQKRKHNVKKLSPQKSKLARHVSGELSSSFSSDSESGGELSSDSDDSARDSPDSANHKDSPFQDLSDDNEEQGKLASALWDNIKNSSDENSGSSSEDNVSSDDERDGKRNAKGSGGGKSSKKKKEKESEGEEEGGTGDDSDKSDDNEDDDDDSGKEKKENSAKEADLDSSDEEDFVGVRRARGDWKSDPLLRGCLTSDEDSDSDSDSDSSQKKKERARKLKKRAKRKSTYSDDADEEKYGMRTPNKKIIDFSDSDVEFVMEKKKTPKKVIILDDETEEVEDDSPSKRGKGRRNIRALVEDDELAEATKQAKKEETERIKRLQEREKAKESFTQSQSFGSQLSEDDPDPLILDVNEEHQIKVHPKISKKLKPHQRSGIQFMWDSCYESVEQLKKGYEGSGCILAHCMGLGKTLQALGLIHTLFNYEITKTKHVLVVCPLSTVANWRNEFRLAFKDIKHCNVQLYTIQDKKAARRRFQIVNKWQKSGGVLVMGYECFGLMINDQKWDKWKQQEICQKEDILKALVDPGPDLVICDEGHLLRNKQTQRNLALNKVATRRRIVLTGTPLQNNLLEYYYMVHFVKPNLLGTEKEFKTNFVNPINNGQFEDSTAIDILFMKKRTHVLHKILNKTVQRVEDTELKQYLPELVDQALFVRLSDLQVRFYNTYLDSANARPVVYTAAGNISRKNFLADIQILRYICTHPDIVTIAKKSGKSKIKEQDVIDDNIDDAIEDKVFSKGDWFKDLIPSKGVKAPELGTKMMMALAIVEEAATNNDKVLIFSQAHAEMDSLEFFLKAKFKFKKGVDYNRMDGTISPEVRTHMCDKFNDVHNKTLKVFIMSTKVGGLGLNLTAANRVILMNVNWNPSYDTQSVFRAFRFGQNKAVYVYRLIAIDTMEEKMYQRQVTKLAVAHRVVDKHQITRHYSAADIQEFYSVRPTIEGERPVPNVPEDRILAKLIQKYPFLYKWHEHQALLANRPEEDLNEQQKNAAWEEFNKKAVDPPPPLSAMQLPPYTNISSLLNLPGPSGMQNMMMTSGNPPVNPPKRSYSRKNKTSNPPLNPVAMGLLKFPSASNMGSLIPPVVIKQTPSGPKLVIQGPTGEREFPFQTPLQDLFATPPVSGSGLSISLVEEPAKERAPSRQRTRGSRQSRGTRRPVPGSGATVWENFHQRTSDFRQSPAPDTGVTVSLVQEPLIRGRGRRPRQNSTRPRIGTGLTVSVHPAERSSDARDNTYDAARKIQEINSIVRAQTTSELIPQIPAATRNRTHNKNSHSSRIDEINSIISASLGQPDAYSSPEWDNHGMNRTLTSTDFPETNMPG